MPGAATALLCCSGQGVGPKDKVEQFAQGEAVPEPMSSLGARLLLLSGIPIG